jgi:CubicO group peptidase (beta-lactamase class C family)
MSFDSIDRRTFASIIAAPLVVSTLDTLSTRPRKRLTAPRPITPPSADFLKGLPQMMEVAGVPGVAIGVVKDGRVVAEHYGGLMDIATRQAVSADTMWPAASLSKPVFALAALHLVDEGNLDLDRPLKSYVAGHAPDDARGDKITPRHVLSHSSGLRNWRSRTDQPLVPDFEPGARFQYSGEGFYYLQHAVEQISGMSFTQFMEQRVFVPLGMRSSTYLWRSEAATRLVSGHDQGQVRAVYSKDLIPRLQPYADTQGKRLASFTHEMMAAAMATLTPAPPILPNNMIPNAAGSLLTTVGDYSAFLIEVLNAGNAAVDLKPATRDDMMTSHTRINSALSWGLGWGVEQPASGGRYLWHWGDNGAWKNFVLIHPESRSGIVIFTNGARGLNVARHVMTEASGEERAAFLWL